MILIGVLGGIASGKSQVTDQLRQLGADVLDADRIGHEVLEEPEVHAAVLRRWGAEVCDAHGRIDRRRLAAIVFAPPPRGPEELAYLEHLTHPRIGCRLRQQMAEASRAGRHQVLVLDAAVMLKAGWDKFCKHILFVDAPRDQRLARALRRGWTETDFTAREAAQETLDVKRAVADVVIDNSASLKHTFSQVQQFWQSLADAGG